MGNQQSVEQSPEARQLAQREAEAYIAAFNVKMDRLRDEAIEKLLQESVLPKATKTNQSGAGKPGAAINSFGLEHNSTAHAGAAQSGAESDSSSITVTPALPSKKEKVKRMADVETASEEDGEHGTGPRKRKRTSRPRAVKKVNPPPFKASIKALAESGTIKVTGSTADLDNAAVAKIKKCLERAKHPSAPEGEAKAALLLASQWMARYNVTQAEVLAHEPPDVQRKYAGQSIVSITRTDEDKSKNVRHYAFVDNLLFAMETYFDCKSYTTSYGSSLHLTFYGIAENTVAAAMALEMAYNLICEWARKFKGVGSKNSYCLGTSRELERMAEAWKAAEENASKKAERDALATRLQQEAAERQAQVDRLAPFQQCPNEVVAEPNECVGKNGLTNGHSLHGKGAADNPIFLDSDGESAGEDILGHDSMFVDLADDESDDDCIDADFTGDNGDGMNDLGDVDEEINKLIKREPRSADASPPPSSSPYPSPRPQNTPTAPKQHPQSNSDGEAHQDASNQSESKTGLGSTWASHMQLVTFRETATKIADEYVKDRGLKLRSARSRSNEVRDWDAYDRGVEDGKKIDVHRKTIKQ